MDSSTGDRITALLEQMSQGSSAADPQITQLVYVHLRNIARKMMRGERGNHTLQPTALVHEAWLKLAGSHERKYQNREHFFCLAARAMRQVLLDHARSRLMKKRSPNIDPNWNEASGGSPEDILVLDQAFTRLSQRDPRLAQIVELRCFAEFSVEETAEAIGLSPTTVKREWRIAKSLLLHELGKGR